MIELRKVTSFVQSAGCLQTSPESVAPAYFLHPPSTNT